MQTGKYSVATHANVICGMAYKFVEEICCHTWYCSLYIDLLLHCLHACLRLCDKYDDYDIRWRWRNF